MKISQICAVVLLLVVGAVMAFADSTNDPTVIVKGLGNSGVIANDGCQYTCASFSFNFKTPASGTGTLDFTNATDVTWTSLTLVENGNSVPLADIRCLTSSAFTTCTRAMTGNGPGGHPELIYSGGTGIAPGGNFAIGFGCYKGGCWPGGLSFGGAANTPNGVSVPEPGTIALMVTGLGALVSRRKQWKNRSQA
jgi:hypothetical protein